MTTDPAHREKRLVALSSVAAAVLLTATKLVVGLASGSLGILSEAAHSTLDLVAACVTYWAVRAATRPPDRDHPYGHGKLENASALLETALLLATCGWVGAEAVRRLASGGPPVEATPWTFAVMAGSIAVDVSRSRALARAARKYGSQALEADALHFATDVWSSAVVIAGLALVRAGDALGVPWLARADAVAALGVAAIAVVVSLRLGRKSLDDLLDAVPEELRARATAAAHVPGVVEVVQLRFRRSGAEWFADLTVRVDARASFADAHAVSHAAERAVRAELGAADVVVHAEPSPPKSGEPATAGR
jgi:cation diffusion facilitator family transporter